MTQPTISQRLHDNLDRLISSIPPGGRLPSEPLLSKQLGVSRATLREAMRTFETQGRIRRRQGSGTYVTHHINIISSGLEVLASLETLAARIGLVVTMGDCRIEIRQANTDEAHNLGLAEESHVLSVDRVILAEKRPVAYLIDILPESLFPTREFEKGFTGSVLDLFLRRGSPPLLYSRTEINAVTANHDIARLLGIQRGDVLLYFQAALVSNEQKVIDFSHSYFLPGYFRFFVNRRIDHVNI